MKKHSTALAERFKLDLTSALVLTALAVSLAACGGDGDGDSFQQKNVPQLSFTDNSTSVIDLRQQENHPVAQQKRVIIRNTGEGDLKVKNIELVKTPERLIPIGETGQTKCEFSADEAGANYDASGSCKSNQVCWPIESGNHVCRKAGFESLPLTVPSGRSHQFEFAMMPGNSINCPEGAPPESSPPGVTERNYCGYVQLDTNANNDSGRIEKGSGRVYFTSEVAGQSGKIEVNPASISFNGIQPGETKQAQIEVKSTGSDKLTIYRIEPDSRANLFSIDPGNFPTDIPAQNSKTWTVELSIPDDWSNDQINQLGTLFINIESSGKNANKGQKTVGVSVSGRSQIPLVKARPPTLRFAGQNDQSLEITNKGAMPIVMRSYSIDPGTASEFYSLAIGGTEIDANIPTEQGFIGTGETKSLTVTFDASAGQTPASIGQLNIRYTYSTGGESQKSDKLSVSLAGDAESAPIGVTAPDRLTFQAKKNHSATRAFAIRNIGTEPLSIDSVSGISDSDFQISGVTGQIQPGGLKAGKVAYESTQDQTKQYTATLESDTGGEELKLTLHKQSMDRSSGVNAKITAVTGTEAPVDSPVVFSAKESNPGQEGSLSDATWIMLERPEGSRVFVNDKGENTVFFPDKKGTYKLGLLVYDGLIGAQDTIEFTAK